MKKHSIGIKAAGTGVIIFALAHLFLNLYIVMSYFMTTPEEFRRIILRLSAALGPIATPPDMDIPIFFIKVLVSAGFFASGVGLLAKRDWARRSVMVLISLRLIYAAFICVFYGAVYMHFWIISIEAVVLTYYLNRPGVREIF
ncbi:MAG: hypothetical protein KBB52_07945 [Candidatus Omnitrophica bacterium]|nr:hypothetical protein [Candidatus Omnitrophota bacterium]